MHSQTYRLIIISLILLLLTACGVKNEGNPNAVPPTVGAYPAPGEVIQPTQRIINGTPYPGPQVVPPTKIPVPNPVPFRLDKPLYTGSEQVSGNGIAGVPILIVNITLNGEVIGKGSIKSDGTFTINLSTPVEPDQRVGIALDDLTGTDWNSYSFDDPALFGDEYMQVALIGFFYDTVQVQVK
jgi:hypothetical protein